MKHIFDRINKDTWIISDTHLKHGNSSKGILNFEPARLTQMKIDGYNADEHDQWVIDNWNSTVKEGENVLLLGDFAFSAVAEFIKVLNGNIIVVLGNHDDKPTAQKWHGCDIFNGLYIEMGEDIYKLDGEDDPMFSGFIKDFNGERYLFTHYPVFDNDEWDRKNKKIAPRVRRFEQIYEAQGCDWNIHGHTHSNDSSFEKSINVSFEQIGFKPIKLGTLLKRL